MEEGLEAGAEVVEPRLPVGRAHEAVLGAAAVAGEAHVALEAVLRQLVELVPTELPLFLRLDLRVLLGFLLAALRHLFAGVVRLSLIHISEPTRLGMISYAV